MVMRQRTRRLLPVLTARILIGAVALASVVAIAPPATAQMRFGMGGPGMGGVEKLDRDAIDEYAELASFDDAQKTAAGALFEAYVAEFDKARAARDDGLKKVREEFADTQDPSVWQRELPKVIEEYTKQTKNLDSQLLKDMRDLLSDKQAAKWTSVERAHRRRQSVPRGMLSGESVDLVRIVSDLKIAKPYPDVLQQALDRYSSELDGVLSKRDSEREELSKDLPGAGGRRPAGNPFNFDVEAIQKAMTGLRKAGLPVRDLNDRFATVVENALPADRQPEFAQKVRKSKYPQVYSDPYLVKAIGAAQKFADVTADQKKTFEDIKSAYLRDIEPANQAWAAEISKAEADGGGDEMMANMARMMSGGGEDADQSPLAKARAARRKIDKDALEKLKAVLTESQREQLPERDDPFGGPVIRMGGGGGGRGR